MPTTTTTHGISYPSGSQAPNIPVVLQTTAESVDAALTNATKKRHAEYTSTFAVAGGLVNWDVGPFTVDASRTFNNTFSNTTSALSGAVNITQAGLYLVSMITLPGASPGNSGLILREGANSIASSFTNGNVWEMTGSTVLYIPAATYIRGTIIQTTGTTNTTRFRITKLAD